MKDPAVLGEDRADRQLIGIHLGLGEHHGATVGTTVHLGGGREGGRERGREGGREGGRKGVREGGREGGECKKMEGEQR